MLAALAILVLAPAAVASASTLSYHNPLRNPETGKPLSCPDPSVIGGPGPTAGYDLVCTSGYARNAFPISVSQDLVHWRPDGFIFPHGHQPWWALKSSGTHLGGRYWAPEINRIGDRWVVYFAAEYDAAKLDLQVPGSGRLLPGRMVIGDAAATSLHGPWHTGVLHFRGQFNGVSAEREQLGPAIDPSVVSDPRTGLLYLFWADQSTQIWSGELSPSGLSLDDQIHLVLSAGEPWECDPRDHHCTIEAPEPFYANGLFYLLYSGASTWDASYDVGVAASSDPLGISQDFVTFPRPILRQGDGFYSTGHTSRPIIGPDGNTYVLYHARTSPGVQRLSSGRYLMLGRFGWADGWPTISEGPR